MAKRAIILGASIGGASLALLLSKKMEVSVYELKPKEEVGKKLCSNICTEPAKHLLKEWGMNPKDFVLSEYKKIKISTKNKSIEFPINEFELDRAKLVETLMNKAEKNGAKFHFSSKFVDFSENNGDKRYKVTFEKNGKTLFDHADFIIGADGAVSEFARKMGVWNKRKHFLYLQGKINKNNIDRKFAPSKDTQYVFVGEDFGYYSYVYPAGDKFSVGLGDTMGKNVKEMFDNYLDYLKVEDIFLQGALIPEPKAISLKRKMKKGLFVIGDAGCSTKFSLGGIIPAMMGAEAVRDIILKGDYSKYKLLKRRVWVHQMATRVLKRLDEKDFEELFEIMKDEKFKDILSHRDKFGEKEIMTLFSPRLAWFSIRKMLFG